MSERDSGAAGAFPTIVPVLARRIALLVVLVVGLLSLLVPAAQAAGLVGTRAQLKRAMQSAGSKAGAVVVDLSTGKEIFAWSPDERLVPASVNKLFTTSTALTRFGSTATVQTRVLADVPPDEEGVVDGDVYLHGGGDPTVETEDVAELAEAVAASGVTEITGRVEGDESLFDDRRGPPSSNYEVSQYVGVLSALTMNRNLTPARRYERQPARAGAAALRAALVKAGVRVRSSKIAGGTAPEDASILATHESPDMAAISLFTNRPSDNFVAETTLKLIGATYADSGSTSAGAQTVREQMKALFGISPRVVDGSGLSRSNRTSAREVTTLLSGMAQNTEAAAFSESLAVAGRNGTLRTRMRGTAAAGKCRGKTGTLNSVSALAGYCTAADGRTLAFAFLANNVSPSSSRALQDRFAASLAGSDLE